MARLGKKRESRRIQAGRVSPPTVIHVGPRENPGRPFRSPSPSPGRRLPLPAADGHGHVLVHPSAQPPNTSGRCYDSLRKRPARPVPSEGNTRRRRGAAAKFRLALPASWSSAASGPSLVARGLRGEKLERRPPGGARQPAQKCACARRLRTAGGRGRTTGLRRVRARPGPRRMALPRARGAEGVPHGPGSPPLDVWALPDRARLQQHKDFENFFQEVSLEPPSPAWDDGRGTDSMRILRQR